MAFERLKSFTGNGDASGEGEFSLRGMRPSDWLIAAGAAAFIAAGIIAVIPFGNSKTGDPEVVAAITPASDQPSGGNFLKTLFAGPTDADDTADNAGNSDTGASDTPLVPAASVRRVATEEIRIEPAVGLQPVQTASLDVGAYKANDRRVPLGCGLILTRADDPNAILFFHELSTDGAKGTGYILIGEQMVAMARTENSGDPLGFGQYPLQVFQSKDGDTKAIIDIVLGKPKDESLRLPVTRGQLIVTSKDGRTATLPVTGEAGC